MTAPRRYYSAESHNGSATSYGFANDTVVKVFSSRQSRDYYVQSTKNISCQAIKAAHATKHATNWSMMHNCTNAPKPFTTECWAIVQADCEHEGFVGVLSTVQDDGDRDVIERFYS